MRLSSLLTPARILSECPHDDAPWFAAMGPREVRGCAASLCNPAKGLDATLLLAGATSTDNFGWSDSDLSLLTPPPEQEENIEEDLLYSELMIGDPDSGERKRRGQDVRENWPFRSFASCYGGHQFGEWADQLGDGRALILGEIGGYEVGLKGCGPTQYSRGGDGAATLRSSAREFLASEYLRSLGVPTTRALGLWSLPTVLWRSSHDGGVAMEPAGMVARASTSFLRFGSFELASARGDRFLLESLASHACRRFNLNDPSELVAFAATKTAELVALWESVGFVHGVLNTDNFQISGETMDFGPFAFVQGYDVDFSPNLSDRAGRYRLRKQADAAEFAINRLSSSLSGQFGGSGRDGALLFRQVYEEERLRLFCEKLALPLEDLDMVDSSLKYLAETKGDFTSFFARLCHGKIDSSSFHDEWRRRRRLFERQRPEAADLALSKAQTERNPRFALRNEAIHQAVEDFFAVGEPYSLERLHGDVLDPFHERHEIDIVQVEPPQRGIGILT